MRFDLKPEAIIHDLRVFHKLYILCVVERTLCRAFTGHRPKGLGYPESDGRCDALKRLLCLLVRRLIQEQGVTHFISGMAQDVDMYAAEIVLAVWNGEPSGTGQTVWYAKEKGKLVWRIDPATLGMEF